MSDGRQIGGIVGAVAGGVIGAFAGNPMMGAAIGSSVGGLIGGMIDPPDAALPHQGPTEMPVNTFHRNLPVPIVYGICKVAGNIVWMGNVRTEVRESGSGKGKPKTRRIYYHADWAVALSEGQIEGVGRIWLNEQEPQYTTNPAIGGKLAAWFASINQVMTSINTDAGAIALTLGDDNIQLTARAYHGGPTQVADGLVASNTTPAPTFRHLAYLLLNGQLGQAPQIPNVSVEVVGRITSLQSGAFPFPVPFKNWQFADQWTTNFEGTMTGPGYPEWIFWIESATAGSGFKSVHRAIHVSIDLTRDFTLQYFVYARVNVLQSAITNGGFAIISNGATSSKFFSGLVLSTGYSDPPTGFISKVTLRLDGCIGFPSADFVLEDTTPAPPTGTTKTHSAWVRIEKRGDTVTAYAAQPGSSWTKVVEGTVLTSIKDGTNNPGRIGVWVDAMVGTSPAPTLFLSNLGLTYFPTDPVSYAQRGNPALIVYDFLTNTRYGVGMPESVMDVASFATEALFCDEDLSLGKFKDGETAPAAPDTSAIPEPEFDVGDDPRFRLDIDLTEKKSALDHLQDMLSTFRAFLTDQEGKIGLRIEKEEDPVQDFTDTPTVPKEGIVEDTFGYAEISSRDRPNRVRVDYIRGDDGYRHDFVTINDEHDQEIRGEVVERVYQLRGIKRQKQANRMAQYFSDVSALVRYVCNFRVGVGALKAKVGDVVTVTHATPGWTKKEFRIVQIREQENDELELSCIEYVRYVYHDREMPATIDGTDIIGADAFNTPPNVLRLRAFEPRDNPLPLIYVTWTLDPAYAFFIETFLFRRRGSGLFEGQGQHIVNASTAWLDHVRLGFTAIVAGSAPPDPDTTTNRQAYWKLEEASGTRNDETANALHLTGNGGVGQQDPAAFGKGALFDGTDDFLSRADASATQLRSQDNEWTICGFFYITDLTAHRGLAGKDNGGGREWALYCRTDGRVFFEVFGTAGLIGTVNTPLSSVSLNTRYFVRAWHDSVNNQVGIQLDGGTKITAATTGAAGVVGGVYGAAFNLGRRELGPLLMKGYLDEWRFFRRLLADDEVTKLINGDISPKQVKVVGDVAGCSARFFDAGNNLLGSGVELSGDIKIDLTGQTFPLTGYVQLYTDAAFTVPAIRGRYPSTGTRSWAAFEEVTYTEQELTYGDDPAELRIAALIGALPATGDLQVEDQECSYTGFVQGDDGDKVTGVTWPLEPAPASLDNRIADLTVYQKESGTHQDRTAGFLSPSTTITLFPANGDELYIGSATKRLAGLYVLLARSASITVQPLFSYSMSADGGAAGYDEVPSKTDGTAGFTQNGLIQIEPPADWVATSKDAAGNMIGDGIARYYLRIVRQAATVTTTPQERRVFAIADLLLTLQEQDNRVDYPYTDDDLKVALTFEALAQSITGLTADTAKVPTDTLTIQQHSDKPSAPSNVQIDQQAAELAFIGGDLVLNWLGTARRDGAGNMGDGAGNDPDGAGGGQLDAGFQNYVVRIYRPDGSTIVRTKRAPDAAGQGTVTYTEEERYADDVGSSLVVRVHQEADTLLSDARELLITAGTITDVPAIANLPGFGHRYVPAMSEVTSMLALPGIAGLEGL